MIERIRTTDAKTTGVKTGRTILRQSFAWRCTTCGRIWTSRHTAESHTCKETP